jgi:hypothetical protein
MRSVGRPSNVDAKRVSGSLGQRRTGGHKHACRGSDRNRASDTDAYAPADSGSLHACSQHL